MTCPTPAGNTHHNRTEVPFFLEAEQVIKCLSDFPHVGIAVVDSRFRFLDANRALASMNGVPAESHLSKTLREILGPAAQQLEPRFESVFSTGTSTQFEFTAKLLYRSEMVAWKVMCFPVRKLHKVSGVCAIVRELSENRVSLFGLTSKLKALRAMISREIVETRDNTRRALDLLNVCLTVQRIRQEVLTAHESTINSAGITSNDSLRGCLTNRELEVVRLIAENKSNKEIAVALSISVKTVEHYRTNAMFKLNAHSAVDLLRLAARTKLIRLDELP